MIDVFFLALFSLKIGFRACMIVFDFGVVYISDV